MSSSFGFSRHFTLKIVLGMLLGIVFGYLLTLLPLSQEWRSFITVTLLHTIGQIFIRLINMLVVPIVFLSLVCGSAALGDLSALGRMGVKTLFLYLLTTALAISIALLIAWLFNVGDGMPVSTAAVALKEQHLAFHQVVLNMFPQNPFRAMVKGNMLQVIVFSMLLGIALASFKDKSHRIIVLFQDLNDVFMRLIIMVMKLAPYGVFCLLSSLTAKVGLLALQDLVGYFLLVLLVLLLQLLLVYPSFLLLLGRLNPIYFFKKMRSAMIFAFSVSSSNASIPLVLRTVEEKLGVSNKVAAFVVPLGATINMDGTAIMQGVATVFIANAYHIHLGFSGFMMVIGMATVASIGTAGVPGVGLITLAMVLQQVGIPLEGIGMIIGIDRLLDMARTAVNISGDAMVSCLVGKSEKAFDKAIYRDVEA